MDAPGEGVEGLEIQDEDRLLRRFEKAEPFATRDLYSNEWRPATAALSVDRKEDGLPVQVERIMTECGIGPDHLCDGESHAVMRFLAGLVTELGGQVIYKEDENDHVLGRAHAIIPSSRGRAGTRSATRSSGRVIVWNRPRIR